MFVPKKFIFGLILFSNLEFKLFGAQAEDLDKAGGDGCYGGASGREVKILQCCHKVCKECWDEWSEVCSHQGHGPLCPVCRNQEFLVAIASAVALPH